jgi:hypothetical protein
MSIVHPIILPSSNFHQLPGIQSHILIFWGLLLASCTGKALSLLYECVRVPVVAGVVVVGGWVEFPFV